jgi:uncharacterized protein (TIGR03000 family)
MLSCGGLLLLAGAVIVATPDSGQARGGGRGGGVRFGGARFGGARFGAGRFGGYRHGGYRGGYGYGRHGYAGYRHVYPRAGYAYPAYGLYGGSIYDYGGYPYYDSNPYAYAADPYAGYDPAYDGWAYGPYYGQAPADANGYAFGGPSALGYNAPYATTAKAPDDIAHITVVVPEGARLWFNGTEVRATGRVRRFHTTPLTRGDRYGYDVRARWNEDGMEVTQTRHIDVTAGTHVTLTFPLPPRTAAQAPAVQED